MAGAAEWPFLKNAPAGERIGAAMLFQDENDIIVAGDGSKFS
jgi:hypothetical protein